MTSLEKPAHVADEVGVVDAEEAPLRNGERLLPFHRGGVQRFEVAPGRAVGEHLVEDVASLDIHVRPPRVVRLGSVRGNPWRAAGERAPDDAQAWERVDGKILRYAG